METLVKCNPDRRLTLYDIIPDAETVVPDVRGYNAEAEERLDMARQVLSQCCGALSESITKGFSLSTVIMLMKEVEDMARVYGEQIRTLREQAAQAGTTREPNQNQAGKVVYMQDWMRARRRADR